MYYLDNNATTKVRKEVLEAMLPYLQEEYGNPSSLYSPGFNAASAIEHARIVIANMINAAPSEIFFTSGGSESNNWAITGTVLQKFANGNLRLDPNRPSHCDLKTSIIHSNIEHASIMNTAKQMAVYGADDIPVPVQKDGILDLEKLRLKMKYDFNDILFVSVMMANNEIGTIQPIESIKEICNATKLFPRQKVVFHTDATQAFGHIPIDVKKLGVDMLTSSGHKLGAPKGVGFIYIKEGTQIVPLICGGKQEKGMRAGTENVAGIVGLGKAAELALKEMKDWHDHTSAISGLFLGLLEEQIPDLIINGSMTQRLPNNLNIRIPGVNAEQLLGLLNAQGIYASAGSACHSGSPEPSHVLKAIGLTDEEAGECIRLSFDMSLTVDDVAKIVNTIVYGVKTLRS